MLITINQLLAWRFKDFSTNSDCQWINNDNLGLKIQDQVSNLSNVLQPMATQHLVDNTKIFKYIISHGNIAGCQFYDYALEIDKVPVIRRIEPQEPNGLFFGLLLNDSKLMESNGASFVIHSSKEPTYFLNLSTKESLVVLYDEEIYLEASNKYASEKAFL